MLSLHPMPHSLVMSKSLIKHLYAPPLYPVLPLLFLPPSNFLDQVWYGVVLRGDTHSITVGSHSNIQDKVVINNTQELETDLPPEVVIEDHVTIGHAAVLTSCHIQDHAVIGMNAVIGTGCFVGRNSMIAAGAVLLPGTFVPAGQLWAGNPAVYIRDIRAEEIHSFDQVGSSTFPPILFLRVSISRWPSNMLI